MTPFLAFALMVGLTLLACLVVAGLAWWEDE
jgi:heme/copper-type cytochrome/quinol oxidase subunit 4